MFKAGNRLRCIAWVGGNFTVGGEYIVVADSRDSSVRSLDPALGGLGLISDRGYFIPSPWRHAPFERIIEMSGMTYAISYTFPAAKEDQVEAQLMTAWKAMPKGQCTKCGAPHSFQNPCAYHPEG